MLTAAEIPLARRWAEQLEHDAESWRRLRWLYALGGLALLVGAGVLYHFARELSDLNRHDYLAGRAVEPAMLGAYIDARLALIRSELLLQAKLAVPLLFGGWLLALAVARRNFARRQALLAAGLRGLLDRAPPAEPGAADGAAQGR